MGKAGTIALFFALVIGLSAVLGWAFRKPVRSVQEKETIRLWIPPEALDLGTLWEDERFSWTVSVENHEAEPIEVESFGGTCNCLSVKPESFILAPGERRELALEIDLTRQVKPSGEMNMRLWPYLKTQAGTESAKRRSPEWIVHAHVRRALSLNRSVYLGRYSELSQPLTPEEIPFEVLVPLDSLPVKCLSGRFTASVRWPHPKESKATLRSGHSRPFRWANFKRRSLYSPC